MATIIDRRLNPSGKNFLNRQKFLRRAKAHIKQTIKQSVTGKQLRDIGKGENVKIRPKDLGEPDFRDDPETGNHRRVLNGNREFSRGDKVKKPPAGKGKGSEGSPDAPDDQDAFEFMLSRDEFLNYLFEDLELPDFVKQSIRGETTWKPAREGFTTTGSPANLNVEQTFKNAIGRRLALRRPTDEEIEAIQGLLEKETDKKKRQALQDELDRLIGRQKIVPYIDETDLKYNLWVKKPHPKNKAVMFCLMDVSGSMGETEKDISKRFFLLLYLFLERRYEQVDIRFIRHTTHADEVDEKTFFYDTLTGGTAISSGLKKISDIIDSEYNVDEWNLYIAQCTDGDNWVEDNIACSKLLSENLLPRLQYFAYIEVSQYDRGGTLFESFSAWPTYWDLSLKHQNLVCKRVKNQAAVWTVFTELFGGSD